MSKGFRGKRTRKDQLFSLRQVMGKAIEEKKTGICSIH